MTKKIYISIFLIFVTLCGYLVFETIKLSKYKKVIGIGTELPSSSFESMDGNSVNISMLEDTNICIIFFSSTCPDCKSALNIINKNFPSFNSTRVVLISNESKETIKNYINNYEKIKNNVLLLHDTKDQFLKTFGSSIVPNLFMYRNHKLSKNIKSEINEHSLQTILSKL